MLMWEYSELSFMALIEKLYGNGQLKTHTHTQTMKAQLIIIVNLFSPISIIEIKFLFRNILTKQIAGLNGFTEEVIPILQKLFQKLEE